MPATKDIKPKPVEATRKPVEKIKPVPVRTVNGAESELRVPAVRKGRASSCPRCPQRDRCERTTTTSTLTSTCTANTNGTQHTASKASCERRRTRSTSTAPKPPPPHSSKTNPDCRRATSGVKHAAVSPKSRETTTCQRQQRGVRAEARCADQSPKAFTVIPPNPKKRKEMQRKAQAELAALEELRLSKAMAYVSINPSSVGGCMSLEEVRLKQQQEMMEAKRKQKPMNRQVMEHTPVLMS